MNLRLIVTILVIAAAPVCAQAQKPTSAKVTKADAQKVLKIISSDKVKTQIYCQMAKLGDQMEQANETGDLRNSMRCFRKCTNWENNWVPNMPRWSTDFRTSTNNPKSVRRLVRPWMRSIICVGGNARSGFIIFEYFLRGCESAERENRLHQH